MSDHIRFRDIIGQETVIQHFQNALRTGEISHAYILNGASGSGRRTLASLFAGALQCGQKDLQAERIEPCGICRDCLEWQAGTHPDIITLTHEKKNSSDKRSDLSVDDIRRMRSDIMIRPYSAPYKVYILPDAEKMTVQAQNALLKMLEEPPEYAVIFLISNGTAAFLPTILSRCVTLTLRPLTQEQVSRWLTEHKQLPKEQADIYAGFSGGSVGKAAELSESEGFRELQRSAVRLLRELPMQTSYDLAAFSKELAGDKGRIRQLIELLQIWYRDVCVWRAARKPENLIFKEEVQYIIEAASRTDNERLGRILAAFDETLQQLKYSTNDELILEVLLIKLRDNG